MNTTHTEMDMDAILHMLFESEQYELTPEVVWSAMKYMKQYPETSIEQACEFGVNEWIK